MIVPDWAYELAREFEETVGLGDRFPRELETAIESSYPVAVVRIPSLTISSLRGWLERLAISVDGEADRPLRGCLAVNRGSGIAFIDALDAADEQRFSVAHEMAHYLRDVWKPRQRLTELFGEKGRRIFDGSRVATQGDRLAGAVADVDLAPKIHFLARGPDGRPATREIATAEASADQLAFELLAPAALLGRQSAAWSDAELVDRLCADYGLPRHEAGRYAVSLRPAKSPKDSWIESLRAAL